MAEQLACNINFFFYTRFVLGFYHEFQISKHMRWLGRLYCFVISTSIVYLINYLQFSVIYPKVSLYIVSIEYLLYVLVSLIKSNKYLLQYYKKTSLIDTSASAYRPMRTWLIGFICVTTSMRLWGFIKIFLYETENNYIRNFFSLLDLLTWINIFYGRSPFLFISALLYYRMRLMRQTMESNNFDCRIQGKNHPRLYIQMYEAIMDGLEKSNDTIKPQLCISIVLSTVYNVFGILSALYYIKYFDSDENNNIKFVWFLFEIFLGCSPLYLSAVLTDLVSVEIQKMLVIILGRRIACKNARELEEIQNLFYVLKNNPFKYSLWRVVPVNTPSLLGFTSFTVTTIIAVLQILGCTI